MLRPKLFSYTTQGSGFYVEEEQKDFKETVFFRLNEQRLWQHAQDLFKLKPSKNQAWR